MTTRTPATVPLAPSEVIVPVLVMVASATPVLPTLPMRTPSPARLLPAAALPRPWMSPSLFSTKVLAPSSAPPISAPKPEPWLPSPASIVP
ncbi:MAG: hypothetical protein AAGK78_10700, partial [Planctomycetota bacterium]